MLLLKEDFCHFGKVFTQMPESFDCRLFLDASHSTNGRVYHYIRNFLLAENIITKSGTIYHKRFPSIVDFFSSLIKENKQHDFFSKYLDMKVVSIIFKSAPRIENKKQLHSLYVHKPLSNLLSELRRLQALKLITMSDDFNNISPVFPSFDDWIVSFGKECS